MSNAYEFPEVIEPRDCILYINARKMQTSVQKIIAYNVTGGLGYTTFGPRVLISETTKKIAKIIRNSCNKEQILQMHLRNLEETI